MQYFNILSMFEGLEVSNLIHMPFILKQLLHSPHFPCAPVNSHLSHFSLTLFCLNKPTNPVICVSEYLCAFHFNHQEILIVVEYIFMLPMCIYMYSAHILCICIYVCFREAVTLLKKMEMEIVRRRKGKR